MHRVAWVACLLALLGSSACSPPPGAKPAIEPARAPQPGSTFVGTLAPGEPETTLPVEADDIRVGAPDADVTIVAFLDFECGFCAQGFATLEQLKQKYPASELRLVMKQLPLDFHPQALPSAVAAQAVQLAAGPEVGFEYARRLFQSRSQLDYASLAAQASEVGVPRELYNELVAEPETVRRVAADVVLSRRHGVDGTPAFFVNGRLLTGAQSLEVFEGLIEQEKTAMQALRQAQPWAGAYATRVRENTRASLAEALLSRDPHDYEVSVDGSPVWGPNDAPLTLVMFTDFECPFCKRVEPTLRELQRLYEGKLRIVFKHKPLPFHKMARPSALVASSIAEKRGSEAFFRAADELFELSPDLGNERLIELGKRYGLSDAELAKTLAGQNASANARLRRDSDLGEDVEAEGTPHFFINGKRLSGARPLAHFRALLDSQLKRASEVLATGVAPAALYETIQKDGLSPGAPQELDQAPSEVGAPTRGLRTAAVTIHAFSDFQCPFCRQGEEVLRTLDARYPRQLRFVWHDLPLDFHARALPAARAGREAFAQKGNAGFWKMHDLLFGLDASGVALERDDLLGYAAAVGLDKIKFEKAIGSEAHGAAIDTDKALADRFGIRGTPAFVVGPYLVTGARPIEHFERLIELILADRQAAAP